MITKDIIVFRLNFLQYQHFKTKYDIIVCNELLKDGVNYGEVYKGLKHFLFEKEGSEIMIIMSDNKEQVEKFF